MYLVYLRLVVAELPRFMGRVSLSCVPGAAYFVSAAPIPLIRKRDSLSKHGRERHLLEQILYRAHSNLRPARPTGCRVRVARIRRTPL